MINNTILNKYKPNANKDLFCDKFIDHLYKSVSTFKTNGIYAKLCQYVSFMYRYDWYLVPEIFDDSIKEEKVLINMPLQWL